MRTLNEKLLKKILKEIKKDNFITERDLAEELNKSERTIRRYIKVLKVEGKVKLIGGGCTKKWQVK